MKKSLSLILAVVLLMMISPTALAAVPQSPTADANGPYSMECQGTTTSVSLDGTGSSDPDGDALTYYWTTDCPSGSFDDPTSATPTLTLDTSSACGLSCNVTLTVNDGQFSDTATTSVTIADTIPPVIACNAPSTITPPDAPISFTATATDVCDPNPSVVITGFECYKFTKKGKKIDKSESCVIEVTEDTITIVDTGGVGTIIEWTVTATDSCGNSDTSLCSVVVVRAGNSP